MTRVVRWREASPEVRDAVEAWLAGARAGVDLRDNPRRRLVRIETADGRTLALKQFRSASGRHATRERVKARSGFAPVAREARALARAHAAGVPVAEPLGQAVLASGDPLLVLAFVEGISLAAALRAPGVERRALLAGLGRAVAALHAAGLVHGDLHHGNVQVGSAGPVLLDLQHARDATRERRLRDLGFLDHSLRGLLSAGDRLRLLRAALGLAARPSPRDRVALREALRAGDARAREHARSRTRRALRPGRAYGALDLAGERGLRVRELPADAIAEALRRHRSESDASVLRLKRDRRSRVSALQVGDHAIVVKEVLARGWARPLADLLRGSPARRAWRAGHGLRFRGIGAARPLAFVERRRFGLPIASALLLEHLSDDVPADRALLDAPECFDADAVVAALGRLALALHRAGVRHDDLKASHVLLRPAARREPETRLIDLEGVRLDAALSDTDRLHALAQLNASLPDVYPAAARCRAFARYARALPFASGAARALEHVVARSLARRHRWTGAGCAALETGAPGTKGTTGLTPSGLKPSGS